MKVLVIPEDPMLDQHILKPIVERIFKNLKRKARIEVLQDPRLRGVSQALDKAVIGRILQQRRMMDLFLLIVDRDGKPGRQNRVDDLIAQAEEAGKLIPVVTTEIQPCSTSMACVGIGPGPVVTTEIQPCSTTIRQRRCIAVPVVTTEIQPCSTMTPLNRCRLSSYHRF